MRYGYCRTSKQSKALSGKFGISRLPTLAEYERAKRYYQKLTGSDLVIAD